MGIRFKSNTWRAPLRLIDNLLPQGESASAPAAASRRPFRLIEAFVRAGWLKGAATKGFGQAASVAGNPPAAKPCSVRVLRSATAGPGPRHDMKLVISGRIGDVCAELERLAAQEQASGLRRV